MKQLKVGTNDLSLVAKKKVTAASVSSTEAFSTVGLALQLEVPTAAATSIRGRKVGEECRNSGLDGWLEVVAASIHLRGGGGQYPPGSGCGSHVGGYPATGDPPHGCTL
jgi:hypothetical protein